MLAMQEGGKGRIKCCNLGDPAVQFGVVLNGGFSDLGPGHSDSGAQWVCGAECGSEARSSPATGEGGEGGENGKGLHSDRWGVRA